MPHADARAWNCRSFADAPGQLIAATARCPVERIVTIDVKETIPAVSAGVLTRRDALTTVACDDLIPASSRLCAGTIPRNFYGDSVLSYPIRIALRILIFFIRKIMSNFVQLLNTN
ncbi:hypothetical protein [Burkholderia sp. SIMBA_062]|uniref:hypothetical protein n=1 Tax=Burkholderia sp. SIMBA_062 TaxID=3085803 RepID=UPI00397BF190